MHLVVIGPAGPTMVIGEEQAILSPMCVSNVVVYQVRRLLATLRKKNPPRRGGFRAAERQVVIQRLGQAMLYHRSEEAAPPLLGAVE